MPKGRPEGSLTELTPTATLALQFSSNTFASMASK